MHFVILFSILSSSSYSAPVKFTLPQTRPFIMQSSRVSLTTSPSLFCLQVQNLSFVLNEIIFLGLPNVLTGQDFFSTLTCHANHFLGVPAVAQVRIGGILGALGCRLRSQLWLRSDPSPGNCVCHWAAKKEKKKKKKKKNHFLVLPTARMSLPPLSLGERPYQGLSSPDPSGDQVTRNLSINLDASHNQDSQHGASNSSPVFPPSAWHHHLFRQVENVYSSLFFPSTHSPPHLTCQQVLSTLIPKQNKSITSCLHHCHHLV